MTHADPRYPGTGASVDATGSTAQDMSGSLPACLARIVGFSPVDAVAWH